MTDYLEAPVDVRREAKVLASSATFRSFRTPEGATGMCEYAAEETQIHLGGETLRLNGRRSSPVRNPDSADPSDLEHCVVLVDGLVVDMTARQFDPAAPFPLVVDAETYLADWDRIEIVE
jgi:hypothetical protein